VHGKVKSVGYYPSHSGSTVPVLNPVPIALLSDLGASLPSEPHVSFRKGGVSGAILKFLFQLLHHCTALRDGAHCSREPSHSSRQGGMSGAI
jgi:hypothetical protein